MLPATLAADIRHQVLHYLGATFDFRDKEAEKALAKFLEDPEDGLFKGPWVQLRRPFRPAPKNWQNPFDIDPGFHPFSHQYLSWLRLAAKDQTPKPVVVTTGTGSGKTECFLFPILDHCLRMKQAGQKGIKAIVLYPMNALASDQEQRFAKVIWKNKQLKAAGIRVGLYTGRYDPADPGAAKESGYKQMGEDHGVSNQQAQQENPPDILLTNYKMLDFLMMRPQDQGLWRFNEQGVFKYLVLDELHTYDGAQGSDVACLIRRLKERLSVPKGGLCVVGTSATIESRDERMADAAKSGIRSDVSIDAAETGKDRLARFAGTLFEENIPAEAIVGEDRLTVEEIISSDVGDGTKPLPDPNICKPKEDEDAVAFTIRQAVAWNGPVFDCQAERDSSEFEKAIAIWSLKLGDWLKRHSLLETLLSVTQKAEAKREDPLSWRELIDRMTKNDWRFQKIKPYEDRHMILASFFALASYAKEERGDFAFPLIPTQIQLWIRELRRLGRVVNDQRVFSWLDEPLKEHKSLPAFHCSECGDSGWVAIIDPDQDVKIQSQGVQGRQLDDDARKIYRSYFGWHGQRDPNIVILSPWSEDDERLEKESTSSLLPGFQEYHIFSRNLVLCRGEPPACCPISSDTNRFRVKVNDRIEKNKHGQPVGRQGCPSCGSEDAIFFIGSQSATICSVAIDEMYGSLLNSDPKLLAFTDSVQDASHRAGFFSSRTYHFTFRTALQHVVDAAGAEGLPLEEAGRRILEHWSQKAVGRPGSMKEAMATLLPPDLKEYGPYDKYREDDAKQMPPEKLKKDIEDRLAWEAVSEFGVMQTHGRTMERSGSSCLAWDPKKIEMTLQRLRGRLPKIDASLSEISDKQWLLWLYGMLHRFRERGILDHPYLLSLAKKDFWGKTPFGRAIADRETYPPFHKRYRPQLLVTEPQKGEQYLHVLAHTKTGHQSPWQIIWTRRSLGLNQADEISLLDLIRGLLKCGAEAGLFRKLHEDANKEYYVIDAKAAKLCSEGVHLVCSETNRFMVRPEEEAQIWENAPSIEYYARKGSYLRKNFSARQNYYQLRYRKGALRRVVAREHTGLLTTEERESVEREFGQNRHSDDPNVLTCTSTLEMGIDIGDLSSTMLCSIPPNTASYLQRIGRAGRSTGTALILSVVNQRPHDLFFFARPHEMLKGKIDPPGCWLDASAVLVRQYLGFCFDQAVKEAKLTELPRRATRLLADLEGTGHLAGMLEWVTQNETELRSRFLRRFKDNILPDTRDRFMDETTAELIKQHIHKASKAFDRQRQDLVNARKRLQKQFEDLRADEEQDVKEEIERERKILRGRLSGLDRTSTLELLIEHGLLPNYAFPERGIRFYGAIYQRHRSGEKEHKPIQLTRGAGAGIKELAPNNHFYTHSRRFEIQQIAIGSHQEPLFEDWAICGACGHMRRMSELNQPGAPAACPQCWHDGDSKSQSDQGQQRKFLEFAQSEALSYMENYESLSADKKDERERSYYQLVRSFDQTCDEPVGAVGEDDLPFGIEYRAAMDLREVNVGYQDEHGTVAFGPDTSAPENGFQVCAFCGVVEPPGKSLKPNDHRRSCQARRRYEKMLQEGKKEDPFRFESVYLYRHLRSEAIRLLLPLADDEDLNTLTACIYLGLRLRFEGDPAHLLVTPQILPDSENKVDWHHLVLMDAVPGGTGYLKTLYQEADDKGRLGEGIMDVMRRALNTLETCSCRKLKATQEDTDGCYRCIRTYHLQYQADTISRERGILRLRELIKAGENRVKKKDLEIIKPNKTKMTMLENNFLVALRRFVEEERRGKWEKTIIKGSSGFRFSIPKLGHLWEVELQPQLGAAQGVAIQCQPDFLLYCDDSSIKPIAIFTDGFEFHCTPNNRLADDMAKRRSILESQNFHVWSVTWEDLDPDNEDQLMVFPKQYGGLLKKIAHSVKSGGRTVPDANQIVLNGMQQLKAFLDCPSAHGWGELAQRTAQMSLQMLAGQLDRNVAFSLLKTGIEIWRTGEPLSEIPASESGEWIHNGKASFNHDILTYIKSDDAFSNRFNLLTNLARIGDSEVEVSGSDFKLRWRQFLANLNYLQFCSHFTFWATSEIEQDTAPDLPTVVSNVLDAAWQDIQDNLTSALKGYVPDLAAAKVPLPAIEYFNEQITDDAFAELAWPAFKPPVAILAGEQSDFCSKWQQQGWKVILPEELQLKGTQWFIDMLKKNVGEV